MKNLKFLLAAGFIAALTSCATQKKEDECCKPGKDCSMSDSASCKGDSCCAPDVHKAKK